jgi:hypothetical protein
MFERIITPTRYGKNYSSLLPTPNFVWLRSVADYEVGLCLFVITFSIIAALPSLDTPLTKRRSSYFSPDWYIKKCVHMILWSWGSPVSILSGYGLDDWAIQVRSPADAKGSSSSLCLDNLSDPPGLLPSGYWGPFLWGKRGQGFTLTTRPI